jgi:hypothetical protein
LNPEHLLRIAKALAEGQIGGKRGRPNQEELRKALSTAYYALFSALAGAAANTFVGSSPATRKSQVWVQTYRALDHGTAKNQCSKILVPAKGQPGQNTQAFTSGIVNFAESFVTMQGLRLDADYNPGRTFYRSDVRIQIAAAEQALNGFLGAQRAERRAFTAFVMHRGRGN